MRLHGLRYEVEGSGPPVLSLHGMTTRIDLGFTLEWRERLSERSTVISVDALGHGKSDKPHEPGPYSPEPTVERLTAILDAVGIERVHCIGFSMGGWHGFALAALAPERLVSLTAIGMHPYARKPEGLNRRIEWLRQGVEKLVSDMEQQAGRMPERERELSLENDVEALVAHTIAVRDAPGFADALPSMEVPCLLIAGTEDSFHAGAVQAAGEIPNARFVELPGVDHVTSGFWQTSGRHVQDFIGALGSPDERPSADESIAALTAPRPDPVFGDNGPVRSIIEHG